MDGYKFRGIRRNIFIVVCLTAMIFLAAGIFLGLWSAREMRKQVADRFNEEQLAIARHVGVFIERELRFLQNEILMLGNEECFKTSDMEEQCESIQKTFSRVMERGVWKIEIGDLKNQKTYIFTSIGRRIYAKKHLVK